MRFVGAGLLLAMQPCCALPSSAKPPEVPEEPTPLVAEEVEGNRRVEPESSAPAPGPSPDSPQGRDLLACDGGDSVACFRSAERAANAGRVDDSYPLYKKACDGSVGLACIHLGQGVEPLKPQRALWLQKGARSFESACAEEDAEACYYRGICLERAMGVSEDLEASLVAYERGCALGHVAACTNAAGMHLAGKGTERDLVAAAAGYTDACKRGDNYACYLLGTIHETELAVLEDRSHISSIVMDSSGVEVRVKDASLDPRPSPLKKGPVIDKLLLEESATLDTDCEAGSGLACYLRGVQLQVGGGEVKKDDAAALVLYEKACDQNNGWGCFRAGDSYERAYGVKSDFAKASSFWLKVCEEGVGGTEGFEEECANLGERMGVSR